MRQKSDVQADRHSKNAQHKRDLEDQAWRVPPGPDRDGMLRRARQMQTASHMQEGFHLRDCNRQNELARKNSLNFVSPFVTLRLWEFRVI
jgi:hypothetical protein